MKVTFPQPERLSYKAHRRQVVTQIILPVILAFLVIAGVVVWLLELTWVQGSGDVSRWAAISTMWIVLPVMVAGIFLFILLAGLVYLLALTLKILPTYTGKAQDLFYRIRTMIIRGADLVVKPVIFMNGLFANAKALFGRKQ